MNCSLAACALQVVLSFPGDGTPVRFGCPLPSTVVEQGLSLRGQGHLQLRPLLPEPTDTGLVWVEIAVTGARGQVRVLRNTARGKSAAGEGKVAVCSFAEHTEPTSTGAIRRQRWVFCDGSIDARDVEEFAVPTTIDGEAFAAGENLTRESESLARRALVVTGLSRELWERAGVLPQRHAFGGAVRQQLRLAFRRLRELPGLRGAGDFARSEGVVTNLEFDTTLGLLRLALALEEPDALLLARRCARHLLDRDLDVRSGLPFPHGSDHRSGRPEPGHVWLQGLLLVGLCTADDDLIAGARQLARALASQPPLGDGPNERARDYAWPLLELEAWLSVQADPIVAAAADRLAASIDLRFDPVARTFRFGEGQLGKVLYLERGWITGGIVLPALQAHLRRRPDPMLREHVRVVEQALLDQIGRGRPGLPTHWRTANGSTFLEHRDHRTVRPFLLLDGLPLADQQRLLRRGAVVDALQEVPSLDDPDLPTAFSMVARCTWVWR